MKLSSISQSKRDSSSLIQWYRATRRDLPWRINRDPYRIWISEVMLQQTTVRAVIPYYERFLKRFPNLKSLARAPLDDVLENWAGLGYYSRARNLHKAAQALLAQGDFPRTFKDLLAFPGFGPYTSRAVASLAFDEKTGVLDGNAIRVLSRRYGLPVEWWKPHGRDELQSHADVLAQVDSPSDLNQGLMELGATVCTPQSPACLLCPWVNVCVARRENKIDQLPLRRPRRAREVWAWKVGVAVDGDRVLLVENDYAPFLKGHWVPPGKVERLMVAPQKFDIKGTVTHHDIYLSVAKLKRSKKTDRSHAKWVAKDQLVRTVPSSLIRRVIALGARA